MVLLPHILHGVVHVTLDRMSQIFAGWYLDPSLQKVGMLVEAAYSMECEVAYMIDYHCLVLSSWWHILADGALWFMVLWWMMLLMISQA
jgi:hypothetical protein